MRKSDSRSVTVYDIEIYGQRILTAQTERVQYKLFYVEKGRLNTSS